MQRCWQTMALGSQAAWFRCPMAVSAARCAMTCCRRAPGQGRPEPVHGKGCICMPFRPEDLLQ